MPDQSLQAGLHPGIASAGGSWRAVPAHTTLIPIPTNGGSPSDPLYPYYVGPLRLEPERLAVQSDSGEGAGGLPDEHRLLQRVQHSGNPQDAEFR